ncbi:MAG TPA: hypothetical protein VM737_02880 [Gemmatimonadota bacterium]|nr:hypothetical protein [Gemmatimonadota bacterium]
MRGLCVPAFLLTLAAAGVGPAAAQSIDEDLAAIREATAKYRDIQAALADGYIPDPTHTCVTAALFGLPAEVGGMGIHYFRPDLLGITAFEPRVTGDNATIEVSQPEVLVYEPQPDGSLNLVAVEYLVFQAAWEAANGTDEPPMFHDVPFTLMVDDPATEIDEAHMFEPHYELHVWTERENPSGMFAEFNPAVSCPSDAPAAPAPHAGHSQ